MRRKRKRRYKIIPYENIKQIRRLLDGYRLKHGYKIVKRKKTRH